MRITIGIDNVIAASAVRLLDIYNNAYNQSRTLESFNPYDVEQTLGLDFQSTVSLFSKTWLDYRTIKTVDGTLSTIQTLSQLRNLGQITLRSIGTNTILAQIEAWLAFMKIPYARFEPTVIDKITGSFTELPAENTDVVIDANQKAAGKGAPLLLRRQP